ncbi:PQQ-dependent sugar dehydrogenase [Marinobacter panjinensis]|uniref:PQQ-dependent sugar dehydrogenase n=1 Tax=Marinobacter panjinensis TaxID=2576384 RepID=UPI001484FB6E|nr:PQQ-dependent sugar dehydrogenase [Marinobacter panjinensis]MCR8915761.1 PQQ-dependent sugar dehydrogenase [Marinobacter panjinensis]
MFQIDGNKRLPAVTLFRVLKWGSWHGLVTIALSLLVSVMLGLDRAPSDSWLPAAYVIGFYLALSLVIIAATPRPKLLFGLWVTMALLAMVTGYLGLHKLGLASAVPALFTGLVLAALAALAPHLGWRGRLTVLVASALAATAGLLIDKTPNSPRSEPMTTMSSALYPLELRRFEGLVTIPAADGGALAVLPDGLLLAGGDGSFQWLAGTEGLSARTALQLDLPAPADRAAYLADFDNPALAPRLRLTDVIFAPGAKPTRLFAAHQAWASTERCYTMRVSVLALDWDADSSPRAADAWTTLYDSAPCLTAEGQFDDSETGGRLAWAPDGALLLTLGDTGFSGLDGSMPFAQAEEDNAYGKIWRIDPDTGAARIVSIGHRNPQGLVVAQNGRVWSSEHGPQGGDEINLIREGANYGWPLVTYGTNYGSTSWPLDLDGFNHRGFAEPALSFVPSVATSAIIEVTGPMFARWKGDLLLATLRSNRLYRLRPVGNRIVYSEAMFLGERLRDLAELPDGSIVAWVDRGVLLELRTSAKTSAFGRFCKGCHAPTFGAPAGPPLAGLIGREVATVPGFNYSPALTALGGVWDEARLDAFLRAPQAFAPGTSMVLPPLDDAVRAELIDYFTVANPD